MPGYLVSRHVQPEIQNPRHRHHTCDLQNDGSTGLVLLFRVI